MCDSGETFAATPQGAGPGTFPHCTGFYQVHVDSSVYVQAPIYILANIHVSNGKLPTGVRPLHSSEELPDVSSLGDEKRLSEDKRLSAPELTATNRTRGLLRRLWDRLCRLRHRYL